MERAMRRLGLMLASATLGAALVASEPAAAFRGGFGGGGFHGGGFGGFHGGGFGGFHGGGFGGFRGGGFGGGFGGFRGGFAGGGFGRGVMMGRSAFVPGAGRFAGGRFGAFGNRFGTFGRFSHFGNSAGSEDSVGSGPLAPDLGSGLGRGGAAGAGAGLIGAPAMATAIPIIPIMGMAIMGMAAAIPITRHTMAIPIDGS